MNKINTRKDESLISTHFSLGKRVLSLLLAFFVSFQPVMPAIGAVLSNYDVEIMLNSDPVIEMVSSNDHQFQAQPYIEQGSDIQYSIKSFIDYLKTDKPEVLDVNFVPIFVGGITTFIPTYNSYKYVGTPSVQTRLIRQQIVSLLGKTQIDAAAYATERDQLIELYKNASDYMKNSPYKLGDNLGRDQLDSQLANDMIWPELRSIQGEEVLVPIVYLTNDTVIDNEVNGHNVQFNGGIEGASIFIDGVAVKTKRDAFIDVANDLIIKDGALISDQEKLNITTGGAFYNLSSMVDTTGDLEIDAALVVNQTLVYRYDTRYEQGSRYGQISSISADGSATVNSTSDILFSAGSLYSGGSITLDADGSISIGPEVIQEGSGHRNSSNNTSSVSYLTSTLDASDTISILAAGEILIDAATIHSDEGHIEILAGLGITIEDSEASEYSQRKYKGAGKTEEETIYETVAIRSILDAGKGVVIHSEHGDIKLKATDISSENGTEIKAFDGAVELLMSREIDHYSFSSKSGDLFTNTVKQNGHYIDTGVPNSIVGGLAIEATQGLAVEFTGDPDASLSEQIELISSMPGLEYLKDFYCGPEETDCDQNEVDLTVYEDLYDDWKVSNTSLTPAAAAMLTIAVAIAAGPAATAASGVVGGGVAGAAVSAATSSLITQASMALANGALNNDLDAAYEQVFENDDTWKSMLVAGLTAGAISAIDAQFFSDAVSNADKLSLGQQSAQAVTHATVQAGMSSLVYEDSDFKEQFMMALKQQAINRIGEYMANKIGETFDRNPDGSFKADATATSNLLKYLSHAGTGCMLGVASASANADHDDSSDGPSFNEACVAGAGGAVVGEYVGSKFRTSEEVLDAQAEIEEFVEEEIDWVESQLALGVDPEELKKYVQENQSYYTNKFYGLQQKGVDLAGFSAALGAFIAGADAEGINIANMTAENAAEHNALPLVAVALLLLKAADIAFTLYEFNNDLQTVIDAFGDSEEAGNKALEELLVKYSTNKAFEKLFSLIIPGFKTLESVTPESIKKVISDLGSSAFETFVTAAEKSGLFKKETTDNWRLGMNANGGSGVSGPNLKVHSVDYLDGKVHPNISRAALPGVTDKEFNELFDLNDPVEVDKFIKEYRELHGLGEGGNVAVFKVEIDGETTIFSLPSGTSLPDEARVLRDGLTYDNNGYVKYADGEYNRARDSERIGYEAIADLVKGDDIPIGATVDIKVISEIQVCGQCSRAGDNLMDHLSDYDVRLNDPVTGTKPSNTQVYHDAN